MGKKEKFLGVGFVKFYAYLFLLLFLFFFVALPLYNWLLAPTISYFILSHTAINTSNIGYLPDGFRLIEDMKP